MSSDRVPSADEIRHWVGQWRDWLQPRTDALLELDERARAAGTDADRADVGAAFIVHKAIGTRVGDVEGLIGDERAAAGRAAATLLDDLGAPVANSIDDAATFLDAIVNKVRGRLDAEERAAAAEIAAVAAAERSLARAETLSESLGMHVNRVAALRARLDGRTHPVDLSDLAEIAGGADAVRAELEEADRRRSDVLARLRSLADRRAELSAQERDVRGLAARCREKIAGAPVLAIPSVGALGEYPDPAVLDAMPWPSARAIAEPAVERTERVAAALAEAARRFRAPLDERDELRGLLQAFRDKADAQGRAEAAVVDGAYRAARDVLWSAPCDLAEARRLTEAYVAVVNATPSSLPSSSTPAAGR